MMIERKHKCLIQKLAQFTLAGGTSEIMQRVEMIAQWLVQHYPRKSRAFLKYYFSVLQKVYAQRYAVVGFAGRLDDTLLDPILHQLNILDPSFCIKEEHPELMGGFKIQQGDNVWDASLKGQLDAFIKNLK